MSTGMCSWNSRLALKMRRADEFRELAEKDL